MCVNVFVIHSREQKEDVEKVFAVANWAWSRTRSLTPTSGKESWGTSKVSLWFVQVYIRFLSSRDAVITAWSYLWRHEQSVKRTWFNARDLLSGLFAINLREHMYPWIYIHILVYCCCCCCVCVWNQAITMKIMASRKQQASLSFIRINFLFSLVFGWCRKRMTLVCVFTIIDNSRDCFVAQNHENSAEALGEMFINLY